MARGKKNDKTLTQEEKLQQTLVPESVQPYVVPDNWRWTRVGCINRYNSASVDPSKQPETMYELYSVPSSSDNYPEILAGQEIGSTKQEVEKGDVLLCKINPRINRVWKISQHTDNKLLASSEWIIIRNKSINTDYLMYCFRSPYFRDYMLSNVSGVGGSLMRAQPKYVKEYPVPIPPLPEQQRIVDRIESLFAKLDEAKEKSQAVVDGFENRKAAILHRAFTGGYSRINNEHSVDDILQEVYQIRESLVASKMIQRPKTKELSSNEYYKSFPSHWKQVRLGTIAFVTKLAGFEYTKYIHLETTGDVPVIRAQNVRSGYLDTTNLLYIDKDTSDLLQRSALDKPSILITFIGAGIGDVCVFDEKRRFHLAPNVAKVEPFCDKNDNLINIRYILHYLMSSYGQHEIFKYMKATAQPSLSMETIRNIIIPIPDIEEQNRIVILLDYILEKELQVKESAEQVIDQIDTMKKSILARAFRGELGTNDPSDESAEELLKRIL